MYLQVKIPPPYAPYTPYAPYLNSHYGCKYGHGYPLWNQHQPHPFSSWPHHGYGAQYPYTHLVSFIFN